jgi:hypothetical protein
MWRIIVTDAPAPIIPAAWTEQVMRAWAAFDAPRVRPRLTMQDIVRRERTAAVRRATALSTMLALGSGLYLYSEKHRTELLDRDIFHVVAATQAAHARTGLLRAEWALLNDPERLQAMADRYLALRPTAPAQFVSSEGLAARLPPPAAPTAAPGAGEAEDAALVADAAAEAARSMAAGGDANRETGLSGTAALAPAAAGADFASASPAHAGLGDVEAAASMATVGRAALTPPPPASAPASVGAVTRLASAQPVHAEAAPASVAGTDSVPRGLRARGVAARSLRPLDVLARAGAPRSAWPASPARVEAKPRGLPKLAARASPADGLSLALPESVRQLVLAGSDPRHAAAPRPRLVMSEPPHDLMLPARYTQPAAHEPAPAAPAEPSAARQPVEARVIARDTRPDASMEVRPSAPAAPYRPAYGTYYATPYGQPYHAYGYGSPYAPSYYYPYGYPYGR